jgi:hypothetical protein
MNGNELKKAAEEEYPETDHKHSSILCFMQRTAYIKGYKKANEWISVEAVNPPKNTRVLCLEPSGNIEVSEWTKHPEYDEDYQWHLDCGFKEVFNHFTHWQPLPTPPNQEQ